jgi:hypothetical protein
MTISLLLLLPSDDNISLSEFSSLTSDNNIFFSTPPSSELISCIAAKCYLANSRGKKYRKFYIGLDRSLGTQEVEAPRISRQSAHEDGKIVSRMHRPPLPPRR